jgi:hypothetical protein
LLDLLGERRHDRVVAILALVVVQLLDEEGRLLAPDGRDVDVYRLAVLAVAGVARLHLGLKIIGRHRGHAEKCCDGDDAGEHGKAHFFHVLDVPHERPGPRVEGRDATGQV